MYAMTIEEIRKGKKKEELCICPYCRSPQESSEEEAVERLKNIMEKGNALAFNQLAGCYAQGTYGMPQDMSKANALWLKAGELGCANAYNKLGYSYAIGQGVKADKKKSKYYDELSAMEGCVNARHNLGHMEGQAGNHQRAMKHFILAAKAGHDKALEYVKKGYMGGFVTKDEYESTLRAYQKSIDEMKSEARDKAAMIAQSAAQRS